MAKKKAPKAKRSAGSATFQAFGNHTISIPLNSKNRTLGAFIKQNIPPSWNLATMGLFVNGREAANDYFLNAGDQVTAAPHVAGGQ